MRYPCDAGQRLERSSAFACTDSSEQTWVPALRNRDPKHPAGKSARAFHNGICGAQVLAPLYRAVLVRPGIQASRQIFEQAFEQVKQLYREVLDGAYRQLQGSSSVVNLRLAMAGPVAALVAEAAWELADATAEPANQLVGIKRIVEVFGELGAMWDLDSTTADATEADSTLSSEARESIAELRATCTACAGLLQVWVLRPATQRLYVSDQRPMDLVRHVRVTLAECADEIVDRMAPEATPLEQPGIYCAVLEILGGLYRSTFDAQFVELSRRISHMDAQEKRAYLDSIANHPIGRLIERTDELFTVLAPSCYPAFDPAGDVFSSDEHSPQSRPSGSASDEPLAAAPSKDTATASPSTNTVTQPDRFEQSDG
jgi:hypothetical protein